MANQKTSDLRRMTPGQLAPGDLFPVVDVSEPTSPTGENKKITAQDWAQYVHDNYTPPGSRFTYRLTTSTSGPGPTLPAKYVLTTVICETQGNPVVSVGTGPTNPPLGASVTGSDWNDNRVYQTECTYDVNYLEVSNYGSVHHEQTVWVQFHAGACPCTFSFEGYTR